MQDITHQYSNKNLVETVCLFQFPKETTAWDNTFFGLLYERIKEVFPQKQMRKGVQIKFNPNESNPLQGDISSSIVEDQMIFQNNLTGSAILMGDKTLSFHLTRNYTNWADFTEMYVAPVIKEYKELGLGNGICICGIMYMNSFSGLTGKVSDYFNIIKETNDDFGDEVQSATQRTFQKNNVSLISKLNSIKTTEGISITFECGSMSTPQEGDLISLANLAHEPIKAFFESVITQNLRTVL